MIERIRLNAAARNQLATLKRRTGIEHNNAICRHALCISLANPSVPPDENLTFGGGVEIEWRTFTGGEDELYLNFLTVRLLHDGQKPTPEALRTCLVQHVHRGLSYLVSRREEDLLVELATALVAQ